MSNKKGEDSCVVEGARQRWKNQRTDFTKAGWDLVVVADQVRCFPVQPEKVGGGRKQKVSRVFGHSLGGKKMGVDLPLAVVVAVVAVESWWVRQARRCLVFVGRGATVGEELDVIRYRCQMWWLAVEVVASGGCYS